MARRRLATDQTRDRIIAAARELLSNPRGISAFTIEAVAEQANVARMTVYYQFESKRGLLEALFEDVTRRGDLARLKDAFREHDPHDALQEFVFRLVYFWSSDRLIIRRLRSLGNLDPEIEAGLRARDQRRRHGLRLVVGRIFKESDRTPDKLEATTDIPHTLMSFEVYDHLAGNDCSAEAVAATVWRLVRRIVDEN